MSKAHKHIAGAHKCLLRPPEDLCGHLTGKTPLENQFRGRQHFFFPRYDWRTFSVGQIHMSKAHKHIAGAHKCHFETSWGPLWASNWQNIIGKPIMRQRTSFFPWFGGELFLLVKFTCPWHTNILQVSTSVFWDLLRTFMGIKLAKHHRKTNHDSENFFAAYIWLENFFCWSKLYVHGTQSYCRCPQMSLETSWGPLWASNWQNILGKPIMRQRTSFRSKVW